MTHDAMIAIIAAHRDGAKIEFKGKRSMAWTVHPKPKWNFDECDYRIAEPKWRDATIDDLKRAPIKARMRGGPKHEWILLELGGIKFSYENPRLQWITVGGARYDECQVIDE